MLPTPAEVLAMEERITRLERECQRLVEVSSDNADSASYWQRRCKLAEARAESLREMLCQQ